jgi:phosphoribosylformylglycinamidine synthase
MGAAGLTSSSVEMAGRAGNGLEMWLEQVPMRETHMQPYEIMLSESQERMLMVVNKGFEKKALAVFQKWDLDAAVIGQVTDTGRVVIKMNGEVYADLPVAPLTESLAYERPMKRPKYLDDVQKFDVSTLPRPNLKEAVLKVISSPNVASKEWVYRQYDHNVRHATVLRPGAADAGVVRVPGVGEGAPDKGIAISTGCNSRFVYLDPAEGAAYAVVEAAANVVATGAEPLAVTDCLNFGNPQRPEIMWQFAEAVKGMGDACKRLETPIVSGNVSLYNETEGQAIHPTPMIGMVGLMRDVNHRVRQYFHREKCTVALVGWPTGQLGGSEYLAAVHGVIAGRPPRVDVKACRESNDVVLQLARMQLLQSCHDVSQGGLAAALAECCISGPEPMGMIGKIVFDDLDPVRLLFGEEPGMFVISYFSSQEGYIVDAVKRQPAFITPIGFTGGDSLSLRLTKERTEIDIPLSELKAAWGSGFRRIVE